MSEFNSTMIHRALYSMENTSASYTRSGKKKHYFSSIQSVATLGKFTTPSHGMFLVSGLQHRANMTAHKQDGVAASLDARGRWGSPKMAFSDLKCSMACHSARWQFKRLKKQSFRMSAGECVNLSATGSIFHSPSLHKWPSFQNSSAAIIPSLSSSNSACNTHLNV